MQFVVVSFDLVIEEDSVVLLAYECWWWLGCDLRV
jgi:hypothetical protein